MSGKHSATITFLLVSVALLAVFLGYRSGGKGWDNVIHSDGRGYYAYLPAFLIWQDPTFDSCIAAERAHVGSPDYLPEYIMTSDSLRANKYFAGVSLLQLPFFGMAAAATLADGTPPDGYSFWFQLFAGLGALVYALLGTWLLYQVLLIFTGKRWIALFVSAAFLFGTNLLYYTVGQPLMSHVYSFFAVNAFVWAAVKWLETPGKRWLVLSGLFLGIVILIRPVNGIVVLLLPFLAGNPGRAGKVLADLIRPSNLSAFLIPFLVVLAVQPAAWFYQTGQFFIWSYSSEGFNFLDPQFREVLFGFRKGLFIYTPLTLLSLTGFIFLFRTQNHAIFKSFIFIIFLIFFIFLTSSWWNWYYGDGFGMRPVIDMYLLFAILLAITLDRSKTAVRTSVIFLSSCFILLNLLQSWQYSKGMIHPFNMDASKYAYIFLRTDPELADSIGGSDEIPWYGTRLDKCCFAFSEKNVVIDSNSLYNTGPNLHGTDLPFIPGRYFVKGDFYVRDLDRGASNTIYFVITIEEVDSVRNFWYGFRINDLPWYDTVSWRPVHFTLNTPVISYRDAYIKTFLWNPSGQRLKVAYFSLMFYPVGQGASRFQEYDSIGRHSLLPADKTELFARLGLDR